MSLRERIDSELKKLADYPESLAERDARYDARDAILKAIEAERVSDISQRDKSETVKHSDILEGDEYRRGYMDGLKANPALAQYDGET